MKAGDYILIAAVVAVLLIFKRCAIIAFFARLAYAKGDVDTALRRFAFAMRCGRLKPRDMMDYGYIALRNGDTAGAEVILTKASMSAQTPYDKAKIKSVLALVAWKKNDLDGAIEMLEDVIDGFVDTTVYQSLGLMYILRGDADAALVFNKKAYEYNSDDLIIADNLAEAYVLAGDFSAAEELYKKILEQEPYFPEPYYGYGFLLIDRGEREEGVHLVEEALEKKFSFLSSMTKAEVEELLNEKK